MSFTTSQRLKKRRNYINNQSERARATNRKRRATSLLMRIQIGDTLVIKRKEVNRQLEGVML